MENEIEFRKAMIELSKQYPVDEIDPIAGNGSWVDNQVIRLANRMGSVWNPLLAQQYYKDAKKALDEWTRGNR